MPLSELAGMLEGRQLDHFAVDQMIGGGGMGAVFRGRDIRLDRVVAIKVIPSAKRDPETLRRFRLEAQAAAKLDHPNIARVYYVGEAEQWNYIVFEFIDGVNIRDLVEMEGPLSVDDAVFYTRQVAEALQHAHEREVVHRDVKPSNVLVTATGSAKVVDMGLARNTALDRSATDATASGVTLGTFDYISPEQARNPRDADVRSDLYSLGCTLFYMLTGHPPFPEGTALQKLLSHGSQPPPDPRGWREDLSDELYEITMKLMAKRPADRYQKPSELISDLMLLAEVEDLPRSQSPGTLLVSPNVAQQSLIETNLSWMVAFAFLLGSTLWLQSVQTLSSDFALNELDFKEPADLPTAPTSAATTSEQQSPPNAATPPRPSAAVNAAASQDTLKPELPTVDPESLPGGEPTGKSRTTDSSSSGLRANPTTLVVSSEQPSDVEPRDWESSLAAAVERVASEVSYQEIEVRGRVIMNSPVRLTDRNLNIRGSPITGATIEIAEPALLLGSQGFAPFDIQDSHLAADSLTFEIALPIDLTATNRGLFNVQGNSHLELDDCVVTVKDAGAFGSFNVVMCRKLGAHPGGGIPAELLTETLSTGDAVMIRADRCVLRGRTNFITMEVAAEHLNDRIDVSCTDTLVAITGSVIKLAAPTGESKLQSYVRLLCSQSTFVSEAPFATLEYAGAAAPLLGMIRTSKNCIYWTRPQVPHVQITGARRQNLLGNFNLLVLQGMNNLYDANIEDVCQCFLDSEKIATFGFMEAYTSGWLGERGNESRIRWQNPSVPPFPLHTAKPQDFAVAEGLFVPGIIPRDMPNPTFQ